MYKNFIVIRSRIPQNSLDLHLIVLMKFCSYLPFCALPLLLVNCASAPPTASISEAQARQTALAAVHGGTVRESELEREEGKDIWSFDIAQPGLKGVKEVAVDAHTGKVLEISVETEAQEKAEAAEEAKKSGPTTEHMLMGTPGRLGQRRGRM
jgi:hypothetical protein